MSEPQRLGKYRLLRRIAVGGVAEVYLAVAEGAAGFAKRVVVKRLMPARARDPSVVAMFLDEARLGALFHHPNVAEVYDIGTDGLAGQEHERYFAMELVDGCDLRDLLDAHAGEPLPLAAAVAIVHGVALGLAHAHALTDGTGEPLGVVHRDVSPSNVLIGRAGEVKLIDFGVAKWTAQRSHTEHGTLKGKFAYMSPEQCRAEPLDARSDIFALGVLLYELTTGVRPFAGDSDFEVMSAIVAGRWTPPGRHRRDYPPALAEVIARALAVPRDDRFPDATTFAEALVAAVGVPPVEAVRAAYEARAPKRTPTPLAAPVPTPRPARSRSDRTATDLSSTPPPRPSRRNLVLAAGAAAIAAVIATALLRRSPLPLAGAVGGHLPPPGEGAPKAPPPPPPPPSTIAATPPPPVRPVPRARSRKPAAPRPAPAPPTTTAEVKIWDPDSPLPP